MPQRESRTALALKQIEILLAQPGRKALTRREALACSPDEASCDRALHRLRTTNRICRFGAGVYGVGRSKLFEAAPQALAALGYKVLPNQPVRGYSQKVGGTVLRLDRACRRYLRGRGVWLSFETPDGKRIRPRRRAMSKIDSMPKPNEIEDHFHRFDHCHSLARAEKDLLIYKALDTMERFEDEEVRLAIDGGASLVYYHRAFTRFSEDIDIRLVFPADAPSKGHPDRIERAKEAAQRFAAHIDKTLPWLTRTRKGRIRKDATVQTFIYKYTGRHKSKTVQPGVKFELVDILTRMPLQEGVRLEEPFPMVRRTEIAAGKWNALAGRIPQSKGAYPDLVRHVHDLAVLSAGLQETEVNLELLRQIASADPATTKESVAATLWELQTDPLWGTRYLDYIERMGTKPVSPFAGDHPQWKTVLALTTDLAQKTFSLDTGVPL